MSDIDHELSVTKSANQPNSTLDFSPSPRRRSHPNLQHLSLAPLTPKYPISPSDYNAYVDPETSQLHTSSSLSHIAGMPARDGLLSQPSSRDSSNARYERSKSGLSIRLASNTPRGALTGEGFGFKTPSSAGGNGPTRGYRPEISRNDSSWILQTGIALTEGSREYKGQSWLAKRASSTSLHSPSSQEHTGPELWQARSGRGTPNRSRRGSRDRRKSRKQLSMTPAATPGLCSAGEGAAADELSRSQAISRQTSNIEFAVAGPEWMDPQSQDEVAASFEGSYGNDFDESEMYSNGDRYGDLDFTGQGTEEEEEEREIKRAVRARGFGLGRWVDGVIDVFLMMDGGDDEDGESEESKHGELDDGQAGLTEPTDAGRGADGITDLGDDLESSEGEMEPAPEGGESIWEDVSWFGRLVLRTAQT
jgi:hypothetical protein